MQYIRLSDSAVLSMSQVRAAHPNTSIPEGADCSDLGYAKMVEVQAPAVTALQTLTELPPVNNTQTWQVADKPLSECKSILKLQAAAKRKQVETGGTTIAGIPLRTDAESQSKLTGALGFVGRKQNRPIRWKGADGTFNTLSKVQIEALSDGAGEFVAKCFDAEFAHCDAIDALATIADCASYNINTGWPT